MLVGYENINFELSEEDLKWVGTGLSSQKVHKIIQHIRTNNIINGICSNGRGYYIAKDMSELEECLISLKQRIYSQMKTLHCLEKQSMMFGGTGQLSIFE